MISEAIAHYAKDPVRFTKDIIGATPTDMQARIMRQAAKGGLISVRSGHGVGKSAMQAWLILWFLCTRPYPKVPCTAPTKHQLYDILWAEVAKWMSPAIKNSLVWTYEKLYMKGHAENWFAVPRTATKPDALQGFHAAHMLYIIDEASGVEDKIFEPALGALTGGRKTLLMCGNPVRTSGFFYDSHNKKKDAYATFKISGEDSSLVDPAYARMIASLYGRDSDMYRVRVLGEFPEGEAAGFIKRAACEEAAAKEKAKTAEGTIDIGIDVARFGEDESVMCVVLDGAHMQPLLVYRKNDTMEIAGRAAALVREYKGKFPDAEIRVKVDCDGLGAGVYDRLLELRLPCRLYECHFGGRGGMVDGMRMANAAALMWGQVRKALLDGRLRLDPDEALIEQLSSRHYHVLSDGSIGLERKTEMKKRGLKSPDRADALVLAMYMPELGGRFVDVAF